MAPLISHIARATIKDDPLGITSVSGFYGPGSWIAWYLTLITSWIAVVRNDQSHNLHQIGCLLYTNWAAIDVIRRSVQSPPNDTIVASSPPLPNGPLGAALSVTWWGVVHATLQYTYTVFRNERASGPHYRKARRRYSLLELGIILPAVAGLLVHIYVLQYDSGALVPALYWPTVDLPQHRYMLKTIGAKALCMVGFSGPAVRVVGYLGWLILHTGRREEARMVLAMFFFMVGSVPPVLSIIYLVALMDSDAGTWNKSCFFMPCAPQSLWDWDQAFTLFVWLFMTFYEFGPGMLQWVRKRYEDRSRRADGRGKDDVRSRLLGAGMSR
jgi:hypothetical protein